MSLCFASQLLSVRERLCVCSPPLEGAELSLGWEVGVPPSCCHTAGGASPALDRAGGIQSSGAGRWGLTSPRCKFCGGSQHGRHCLLRVSVDPRALQQECPVGKKLLRILQRLVIVTFPQGAGSSGVRAIRSFPVCLWWVSNFGIHDCLGSRWDPIF
ncbi:T. brucei spp.-specific protein [Trypanosoma brucei gambiense DAL972]|uniref:T. brucei spp.-specific protein n=1 Tax=Trypanosoma brucei gambiense (strain MHOM/CI/86/DAL972) TaxID=679716 RepID=D0A1H4_TRYB9|nr:T. brucei spp.-specific protein [Trypanosoma brucei gambiense DAL972]CBH15116.1 T. brucei spp.-specific protein [Trypanosoma brucei gambiense DAL972]|eukprot:XP_011777382.1 T. brucei spp.-specific protein [Trypanosoma brucei gambiense DAL972]